MITAHCHSHHCQHPRHHRHFHPRRQSVRTGKNLLVVEFDNFFRVLQLREQSDFVSISGNRRLFGILEADALDGTNLTTGGDRSVHLKITTKPDGDQLRAIETSSPSNVQPESESRKTKHSLADVRVFGILEHLSRRVRNPPVCFTRSQEPTLLDPPFPIIFWIRYATPLTFSVLRF